MSDSTINEFSKSEVFKVVGMFLGGRSIEHITKEIHNPQTGECTELDVLMIIRHEFKKALGQ